jgi:predicted flap endonuclease-1-like 5' DNA nuclease
MNIQPTPGQYSDAGDEDVRAMCGLPAFLLLVAGGLALLIWRLWRIRSQELRGALGQAGHELRPASSRGLLGPAIEIGDDRRAGAQPRVPEVESPCSPEQADTALLESERAPNQRGTPPPLAAAPAAEDRQAAPPVEPDDLKRIEGIGPKIAGVLRQAGINSFTQLADADLDRLRQVLEAADPRLGRLADPGTWPEQARFAAKGDWQALAALQSQLKGGRRV